MRNLLQVQARLSELRSRQITERALSLPKGHQVGFALQLTEQGDNVQVLPGQIEVNGETVSNSAIYALESADYLVSRLRGVKYYLYVDRGRVFKVSTEEPVVNATAFAWTHPYNYWRYLGSFSVAALSDQIEDLRSVEVFEDSDQMVGTDVPSVPVISLCKSLSLRAIIIQWDTQEQLRNFARFEIQVSSDEVNWYSIEQDGTDWKDVLDADTDWPVELFIHGNIPLAGTDEAPTGRTLYYRVRRVTTASVASAWSASVSATAGAVQFGEIAADAITASQIQTGLLAATTEVVVGQDYTGSPTVGAQRIVIDDNELALQEYDGDSWETITKFGGDDQLKWYLQARGLVKTGADITAVEVGDRAPSAAKVFDFENDYEDKAGTDPWDTKSGTRSFSTDEKFGSYALTGNDGYIEDADGNGLDFGNSFGLDAWLHVSALPTYEKRLALIRSANSTTVDVQAESDFESAEYTRSPEIVRLDKDKFLVVYCPTNGTKSGIYAAVGTISGPTISWGTPVQMNTSAPADYHLDLCALSETTAILYYTISGTCYARKISISGTTPAAGAEQTIASSQTIAGLAKCAADKVIFLYYTTTTLTGIIGTFSGDTVSLGSSQQIATNYNSYSEADRLDTDSIVVVWDQNDNYTGTVVLGVSGTTITVNTPATFTTYNVTLQKIAALSPTKFVFVCQQTGTAVYAVCGSISGTTITLGSAAQIDAVGGGPAAHICALSWESFMVAHLDSTAQYLYATIGTVSGTTITAGANTTVENGATYQPAIASLDENRAIIAWGEASAYIGGARACFMRGTSVELALISTGLRMAYFNSQNSIGRLTDDIAVAAGAWRHVSINFYLAGTNLYLTVDGSNAVRSVSGHTLVTGACSLHVALPETAYAVRWDDLLLLADNYLNYSTDSLAHYTAGQPWVDAASGIDYLLDLFLLAKSGGNIKLLGDTVYTGLFQRAGAEVSDLTLSSNRTSRVLHVKDLTISDDCVLAADAIICEGDLTIETGKTLTVINCGYNPNVASAITNHDPLIYQAAGGSTGNRSGAGAWGGNSGATPAGSCGGGGGSYFNTGGNGVYTTGSVAGGARYATPSALGAIGGGGGAGMTGGGGEAGGGGGAGPGGGGGASDTNIGGRGGGTCLIIVKGNLTIESGAVLDAAGETPTHNGAANGGGGGGGGCICLLVFGTYDNSGTITAAGGDGSGNGNSGQGNGGGGGGGHVEIFARTSSFGTIDVAGGIGPSSAVDGGTGTQNTVDISSANERLMLSELADAVAGHVSGILLGRIGWKWWQ